MLKEKYTASATYEEYKVTIELDAREQFNFYFGKVFVSKHSGFNNEYNFAVVLDDKDNKLTTLKAITTRQVATVLALVGLERKPAYTDNVNHVLEIECTMLAMTCASLAIMKLK